LIARIGRVDILYFAHQEIGIGESDNFEVTGEDYLVAQELPRIIGASEPVIFDVGANWGEFSKKIRAAFPSARVFAFEPLPSNFEKLKANLDGLEVECWNLGLGSTSGTQALFDYPSKHGSAHASLYPKVFSDLHQSGAEPTLCEFTTLDSFCDKQSISVIDFLKVDVEGHELEVLRGAKRLLASQAIRLIQFEFNEMNVISRTFLKDFYDLLGGFEFWRVHSRKLIRLGKYNPINEIFRFQNILAVAGKSIANVENI